MITEDLTKHPNGIVDKADVCLALDQILVSRPFRSSNQCSGLLRYIVEHTLAGEENLLRERVIGAELFGRPADYETSEDPVVRLRVSEVRKRLAQYYLSARDERGVQIEIPSGSYRATFHWNAEAPAAEGGREVGSFSEEVAAEPDFGLPGGHAVDSVAIRIEPEALLSAPPKARSRAVRITVAAVAVLLLVALGAVAVIRANSPGKAFRSFWSPWTSSPKPVIISIGSNAVYRFQSEYVERYAKQEGLNSEGQEVYVPLEKDEQLAASDLYPAYNSFVALGDVAAVSRIVATLTKEKKLFQERFPNDVSFAELRDTPSVLVGGFNNPMTLALAKQLPFVMRGGNEIDDTADPKHKWLLNAPIDSHDTADYAIITRLVQRNGDSPVIIVAGLGQYGTLAAAELICSPTGIHLVTDRLSKDWPDKNLQAVLRIHVVDFKPTAPEVVGFRSW
jgi:hypothetical protein